MTSDASAPSHILRLRRTVPAMATPSLSALMVAIGLALITAWLPEPEQHTAPAFA